MWRPPGCGGPWAAFSSGAVEAHPTLEYQHIKGDKTCGGPLVVEAPGQPSVVEPGVPGMERKEWVTGRREREGVTGVESRFNRNSGINLSTNTLSPPRSYTQRYCPPFALRSHNPERPSITRVNTFCQLTRPHARTTTLPGITARPETCKHAVPDDVANGSRCTTAAVTTVSLQIHHKRLRDLSAPTTTWGNQGTN